jgi:hypothetical protein
LEKYPDHELAEAARYELEHMGKEVDDLPFMIDDQDQNASQQSAQKEEASSTN